MLLRGGNVAAWGFDSMILLRARKERGMYFVERFAENGGIQRHAFPQDIRCICAINAVTLMEFLPLHPMIRRKWALQFAKREKIFRGRCNFL